MREVGGALAVLLCLPCAVHAARWIGPGSITGPVEVPQQYEQAVESLVLERLGFDEIGPGTNCNGTDLGGVTLATISSDDSITAQADSVAGAEPASAPIALLVDGLGSDPVRLDFDMTEPVMSVGFVLMGLESLATLKVYGQGDALFGSYTIPPGAADERRWIGIAEDDREIHTIQLQPMSFDIYAIDDVELGTELPEPGTFALCAGIAAALGIRTHRNTRRGRG